MITQLKQAFHKTHQDAIEHIQSNIQDLPLTQQLHSITVSPYGVLWLTIIIINEHVEEPTLEPPDANF